jgi:hypothetical protein
MLNQFDLSEGTPQLDSVMIYEAGPSDQAQMQMLQVAPNGKIFISCFAGGFYILHALDYPDELGDSCEYVDTAIVTMTANTIALPNMINYNLGPLVGSGCDTIPALCNSAVTSVTASICKGQTYALGNFTHNQTGFYFDTLQNIIGCDSIISLQLTVDSVVALITQPSPDTLIVNSSGNIAWLDCASSQIIDGANSDTFVPQKSGTYSAIVTSGNCSDTSECVTAVVNGIEKVTTDNLLRIMPNPADKYLYVEMGMRGDYEFQLLNEMVQLVDTKETPQVDIFDTELLTSGVYFLKVTDRNSLDKIAMRKVIIQH